jgi:hypothetical protein
MQRLYQTQWHGIEFERFGALDASRLPDGEFYARYYGEFFRRFASWEQLDERWRQLKDDVVEVVLARCPLDARVLSLGSGIGYVEKQLVERGMRRLEVHEITPEPLRWMRSIVPPSAIHVGWFPDCLPPEARYDAIFMSGVDACMSDAEWAAFLRQAAARLAPGGRCLVVSPTLDREGVAMRLKQRLKDLLHAMRLRHRGQLWGFCRSAAEYRRALREAGLAQTGEAFIANARFPSGTYWIEGRPA